MYEFIFWTLMAVGIIIVLFAIFAFVAGFYMAQSM